MIESKNDFIRKIHLIISVAIVIPVGLLYGFYPDFKFDLHPVTLDEFSFFKAIMGLYLGFAFLWGLGVFKTTLWKTAIISNIIFMLGLGFGRLISLLVDGTPGFGYTVGTFAELFLGFYGVWVLRRKHISTNT